MIDDDSATRDAGSGARLDNKPIGSLRESHIAGAVFVLRRLPLGLLQSLVDMAVAMMSKRHPTLIDALAALGDQSVLIDPSDVPVTFLVRFSSNGLDVRCSRASSILPVPSASIEGRLAVLVGLAEGEIDGDALFFTRDLTVRGATGNVLVLRNALERAELSLSDEIGSILGPFTKPVLGFGAVMGGVLEKLDPILPSLRRSAKTVSVAPAGKNSGHSGQTGNTGVPEPTENGNSSL